MRHLRPAIVSLLLFTLLCGVIHPVLVTAIAGTIFPHQAQGSIIMRDGKPVGSELIAQPFSDPKYFWPRLSAASYNGASSGGSNFGPTAPALLDAVKRRIADLRAAGPENKMPIPVDLVTASGSGLDPHITPAAAQYQLNRVARARNLTTADVQKLVDRFTSERTFGVLGEPTVNVLQLNLALDGMTSSGAAPAKMP